MENFLPVKMGLLLAVITLIYGFGLGGAFGGFEEGIKKHLKYKANRVLNTVYQGNKERMKKVIKKSWVYFKRAHLHANGLGAVALGLIILLAFLAVDPRIKGGVALCLGLGSLGYSLFWMFAALTAPELGGTALAKESLNWLAVPSAALAIAGVTMVFGLLIWLLFVKTGTRA